MKGVEANLEAEQQKGSLTPEQQKNLNTLQGLLSGNLEKNKSNP
jgi:hypothetical protein